MPSVTEGEIKFHRVVCGRVHLCVRKMRRRIGKNAGRVAVGVRGFTKRSGVETKYEFRRLNIHNIRNICYE
jgi:hypothetical protein